ncbi:hypothetical protein SAMN05444413_105123 [Roseivivax marinus]|uniref:hypothetical protein n=1 Tax=Roseivivax marinus TaxID=1379903 RepID=UPI0008B27B54|nr:hypothetical protein [Roseivivax marinus]SEL04118.1 hypothetical protein SAMN05444413_105123 [Roseivivax marinus]
MHGHFLSFFLLASMAIPAAAQDDDPMAFQRCIWRCLAAEGPADNPAYHQCVARVCGDEPGTGGGNASSSGDPTRAWQVGRAPDGRAYAGVDGVRGQSGLYYFCGDGAGTLRVVGIDGGERRLIVDVDGRQFDTGFERSAQGDFPEARMAPSDPLLQALQSGSRVKVLSDELGAVVDATLSGSSRALGQVISGC